MNAYGGDLKPTGQNLDFYMGANSWMEPLPGLSRAPELVDNAYKENNKNITGRGIPIVFLTTFLNCLV